MILIISPANVEYLIEYLEEDENPFEKVRNEELIEDFKEQLRVAKATPRKGQRASKKCQ